MKLSVIYFLFIISWVAMAAFSPKENIPYHSVSIDSAQYYKHKADSLKVELFLEKERLNKVLVYCKIVERKPSQVKFLKGWVARAIK